MPSPHSHTKKNFARDHRSWRLRFWTYAGQVTEGFIELPKWGSCEIVYGVSRAATPQYNLIQKLDDISASGIIYFNTISHDMMA